MAANTKRAGFLTGAPAGMVGTKQIVANFGCSRMSLWRWMKAGLITPVNCLVQNYFLVEDVDHLAQEKGYPTVNTWGQTQG